MPRYIQELEKDSNFRAAKELLYTYKLYELDESINDVYKNLEKYGSSAAHSEEGIMDHLSHHGVKGMKWGVRKKTTTKYSFDTRALGTGNTNRKNIFPKSETQKTGNGKKNKKTNNSDDSITKALKTGAKVSDDLGGVLGIIESVYKGRINTRNTEEAFKEMSKMTDDDLRKRINRLNLENQYIKLRRQTVTEDERRVTNFLEGTKLAGKSIGEGLKLTSDILKLM